MSLESQIARCYLNLAKAMEHAGELRAALAAEAISPEEASHQEAKLVALTLSGLVDLGLDVSDLPALEVIAAVLRYWPHNARVILTLLPEGGTEKRKVKPWLVGGKPWVGPSAADRTR